MLAGFPQAVHFSWVDFLESQMVPDRHDIPEWEKAKILNRWLIASKQVSPDDIILCDGFWTLGLESLSNVVSVCHGNWSHTTADDVAAGIPPEFPLHHAVQVRQRADHLAKGKKLVAVSDFIADQMMLQWQYPSHVINNGIDTKKFRPYEEGETYFNDPTIVHMTTTANKGFDHIAAVKERFSRSGIGVYSLDELWERNGGRHTDKYRALAACDLLVHPSAHEGNSYGILEALASDVPIVSYDVGLMYFLAKTKVRVGKILSRQIRSPEATADAAWKYICAPSLRSTARHCRAVAEIFSIEYFHTQWREFLEMEFGYAD